MPATDVSKKRGPYKRTRLRREAIAQTVLDIVDEVGYEFVTTALVAERSSTNEATVLYHFPSKDHLLVAALHRADELAMDVAGAAGAVVDFDLESLAVASRNPLPRERLLIMMRGQSTTIGHPAHEFFRDRVERSIDIFAGIIERRQEAGLAHPSLEPRDTARQFIALWEGITVMAALDLDFSVDDALVQAFRRLTGENMMEARAHFTSDGFGL